MQNSQADQPGPGRGQSRILKPLVISLGWGGGYAPPSQRIVETIATAEELLPFKARKTVFFGADV